MASKKRKMGPRRNKTVVNAAAKRELDLFIENTGALYPQKQAILANVKRRRKSGKYDAKKAPKLWMYWVDAGAKQYNKEFGNPKGRIDAVFDKPTREAVARDLANRYAKGEE
jgi:hypothetical protein